MKLRHCLLAVVLLAAIAQSWAQEKSVRIATFEGVPWATEAIKAIVVEAYRRSGHTVVFSTEMPLARASLELAAGRYDAALAAFADASALLPNMRRITPALGALDYAAYSLKPVDAHLVKDWATLRASSLSIAGRHGLNAIDRRLGPDRYTKVTSDAALLRMLALCRVDVVIAAAGSLAWASAGDTGDLGPINAALKKLGTLERMALYHYVDARRAELVPLIGATLEQMEKDGTIAMLWQTHASPPKHPG